MIEQLDSGLRRNNVMDARFPERHQSAKVETVN